MRKILIISGITMADVIGNKEIIEYVVEEVKPRCKIPHRYTVDFNWPRFTDLLCWRCDGRVYGPPWAYVTAIDNNGENRTFHTDGNYCNPWCCTGDIYVIFPDPAIRKKYLDMFAIFYNLRTGYNLPSVIPRAPSKKEMIDYGGNKTRLEYEAMLRNLSPNKKQDINLDELLTLCD